MLKGIDPLLGPELLAILRAMGHGDEIALVDSNFPAASLARRLVRLDGSQGPRALRAILSVLPLDDFVRHAAFRMEVGSASDTLPEVAAEFSEVLKGSGYVQGMASLERHAFYSRAREAYAIVATGEPRFWGNLILKKGTIAPAEG